MVVLTVSNLVKRFGSLTAVDGVSFTIEKGSCFGLLGPNGAGKTTTISMIVGVSKPDSGSIAIEGLPVNPTNSKAKRRIGYAPQDLALWEELSAAENLRIFGSLYDLEGAKLRMRIAEVLTLVGLTDRSNEPVRKFSGGMKRRLNIAAALLHEPEFLVLDEPTVGVDPQSRNAIFDSLRELRSSGMTMLYTTHYMEEVEKLCDFIAVMDHAKVIANGTLADLHKLLPSENRLVVELAGNQGQGIERTIAILKGLPGVTDVHLEAPTLKIDMESLAESVPHVLQTLSANQIAYDAFNSNRVSLEEVFLSLTGRTLRD